MKSKYTLNINKTIARGTPGEIREYYDKIYVSHIVESTYIYFLVFVYCWSYIFIHVVV